MDNSSGDLLIRCMMQAVHFASVKHKNQRRKDPEQTPYINHPIGVAHILVFEAGITDMDTIQAALLHDTVEDTDTSPDEINTVFGPTVASIVAEVTDDKTLSKSERKQKQVERAPHCSRAAKLVKLADKLYNVRDLMRCTPSGWSQQRVTEYLQWSGDVLNGLRGTNSILENSLDHLLTSVTSK